MFLPFLVSRRQSLELELFMLKPLGVVSSGPWHTLWLPSKFSSTDSSRYVFLGHLWDCSPTHAA